MPLLSVYNHLMQGLIMMRPNRFDTHKKSELQNVYRDIMRLTSEQPLYKVTFDESAQEYTLGIKNSAIALSSMVKELNTEDESSVFKNRILVSSEPETIDVTLLEGSSLDDSELPLNVNVANLATPQENHGHSLPSQESALLSGQYNFTIGIEDNTYSFQFNVSKGSTNLDLQQKLSNFINKTAIGLKTRVIEDKITGVSRLDLISVTSGHSSRSPFSFYPSDVRYPEGASYGIIEHFGLNNTTIPPTNTTLIINGIRKECRGHTYLYKNKLALSIKKTCKTPISIDKITNQSPIFDKIQAFVDNYNSIFDFVAKKQPRNHRARKLLYELGNTMRRFSSDLKECGINVSKSGTLSIDKDTLHTATSNGSLEHLFSKEHTFSSTLLKKLSDISINPMEYLNKTLITYPNIIAKKTPNPYISSIYCGLLYNNYS